jgi:curved DNA-binding protein CbpA
LTNAFTTDLAQRIPVPIAECDVRSLPLSPSEAFLLSRIDGCMSEEDLGSMTGVDVSKLHDNLERLARLGAIRWARAHAPRPTFHPPPSASAPRESAGNRHLSHTQIRTQPPEAASQEQVPDLEPARQKRVLDMFAMIQSADYYALLGLSESADRKDIKRAYYAFAPEFHPDKFFGKRLGSFKAKMEAVFAQLTLAYETLSSADKRSAYDTYLAAQRATRSIEKLLSASSSIQPGSAHSESPSERAGNSPAPLTPNAYQSHRPAASPSTNAAASSVSSSRPPRTAEDEKARRAALARKLGGGRGSLPPEARRTGPQPEPGAIAADELRRRHEALVEGGRRAQVQRHLDAAKEALSSNPAAASNAYRLALALDPENPEIILAHREASQLAAAALAQGYLKQAEYEARAGHPVEAARSYARAAAGMPNDVPVLEIAASTSLKAGVDLHQAVQFARRALELAPTRLPARYVLIEAYLMAKLPLAARRELEAAREIAPQDDTLDQLAKRLK